MIHIPEGNYLTILEAAEWTSASRFSQARQAARVSEGQAAPQNPISKTGWQSPACFYLSLISIFASLMTICSIRKCKR